MRAGHARDLYHIAPARVPGGARMADSHERVTIAPVPRMRVSRRVVGELRPHWWRVTLTLLVDLLETPVILLTPIPLKIVIDSVIGDHPPPAIIAGLPLASSPNGGLW